MRDESWLVVDTETDGFSEPVHVVEIAAQRMRGWQRDGEAFRVLLNHDVPIDPMAEALHGYSREYLRVYGQEPETAHGRWREYAADQPSSPTTSALIGTGRSSRSTRALAFLRLDAAGFAQ